VSEHEAPTQGEYVKEEMPEVLEWYLAWNLTYSTKIKKWGYVTSTQHAYQAKLSSVVCSLLRNQCTETGPQNIGM